eukprot:9220254-Alexandrium_andersonii.AAC.1
MPQVLIGKQYLRARWRAVTTDARARALALSCGNPWSALHPCQQTGSNQGPTVAAKSKAATDEQPSA